MNLEIWTVATKKITFLVMFVSNFRYWFFAMNNWSEGINCIYDNSCYIDVLQSQTVCT
jgi:hypothetical protein